ncbi:hypothetical protein HHI36_005088 [Cryptolaemus montrouzieri]|uniref:GIY-YIG homing endonuclease n=1 Tax=Cryptolaemus montrouzieri TaxID=559131 RepID=A0ABD2NT49_9CUCU
MFSEKKNTVHFITFVQTISDSGFRRNKGFCVLFKICVNCKDCDAVYIGRTKQLLASRMTGDKPDCNLAKKGNTSKQIVASVSHSIAENHEFDYGSTALLCLEENLSKRKFKEMVYIQKTPNPVNNKLDTNGLSVVYGYLINFIKLPPPRWN